MSNYDKEIARLKTREQLLEMAKSNMFIPGDPNNPSTLGIRSERRKTMMRRMEDLKYTKGEVRDMFAVISAMTEDELDFLIDDKTASVLEKVLARTYKEAIIFGSYKRIRDIIELFADKAAVVTNSNVNHNFNIPNFKFADPDKIEGEYGKKDKKDIDITKDSEDAIISEDPDKTNSNED